MSSQQKRMGMSVGLGIIIGSVITGVTGDGIWIAIGVVVGSVVGGVLYQMAKD